MKRKGAIPPPQEEFAAEDSNVEVTRPFKRLQLRLLMKDREEVVNRLVQLDYSIWVLEEFFRAGSP